MKSRVGNRMLAAICISGMGIGSCGGEKRPISVNRELEPTIGPVLVSTATAEDVDEDQTGIVIEPSPTWTLTLTPEPIFTEEIKLLRSGEIYYGEQFYAEENGETIKLGRDRFVYRVGDDEIYFIDPSGQGVIPDGFGRQAYLYYVDEEGEDHHLPLYLQHDPRWGTAKFIGSRFNFGRRGCGQTVAASFANLAGIDVDPYSFGQYYLPDWNGSVGTNAYTYRNIFLDLGLSITMPTNGIYGINAEVANGKLVMALVKEEFRWWGAKEEDNVVDHFVLFYPGPNGEVKIWDPWWGEGVDESYIVEVLSALVIDKK